MILYILRHGQTEYNRLGIVQGSRIDAVLNEEGWQQGQAFWNKYQNCDFDLVVTSTLQRTRQTVQAFIDAGIPWEQHAGLNEIDWGIHEGEMHNAAQNERYHRLIQAWQSGDLEASVPEGESARALHARIAGFVDWLHGRHEQKILVATHGRALRCLIAHLKGLPMTAMESVSHANTGLYRAQRQANAWHFDLENDLSHLSRKPVIIQ